MYILLFKNQLTTYKIIYSQYSCLSLLAIVYRTLIKQLCNRPFFFFTLVHKEFTESSHGVKTSFQTDTCFFWHGLPLQNILVNT